MSRLPLALIHGWGMPSSVFAPIAAALRDGRDVIAPALPGYEGTPPAEPAGDLSAVAARMRAAVPAPAVWVGWSLGGLVALAAAAQAPGAVRAVVMVASNPCFVRRRDWGLGLEPDVLTGFAEALATDREGTLKRFLALQTRGAEQAGATLRLLRERIDAAPPPDLAALRGGLEILRGTDLRATLAPPPVPVCGIFGRRDALVPATVADWLAAQPGCRARTLERAGHAPFLSHPERFVDILDDCLEAID